MKRYRTTRGAGVALGLLATGTLALAQQVPAHPEAGAAALTQSGAQSPEILFERLARLALLSERDPANRAARTALLHALSRQGKGMRAHLSELEISDLSEGHRRAAIWALAEVGGGDDIDTLLLLVRDEDGTPSSRLQRDLEEAMVSILARQPRSAGLLGRSLRGAEAGAVAPVSIALGRTGGQGALEVLRGILEENRDLATIILPQIRKVLRTMPARDHADLRAEVRDYLEDSDLQTIRAAAGLVDDLEDEEAFPRLLELLDFEGTPAYAGALSALRGLARHDLGKDPSQWAGWYDKETTWYRSRVPALLSDLDAVVATRVLPALTELGRHPLYRRPMSMEVARALHYPDPRVRTAACQALVHLGSGLAPEILLQSLEDEDPMVAQAALDGLKRLTGQDHPAEVDAWLGALTRRDG